VSVTDGDDEFDEDEFVDEFGGDQPSEPWHNSTRAVLGASAVGVAVIAGLVAAVMFVTGEDEPADVPLNFVDPSFSATASRTTTSTPTTTATITSTAPLSTTEINTSTTTSNSSTSSSESSSAPRQREDDDGPITRTPRRMPRTNVTRTLLPRRVG
jgi:Flp pilus assembly pilin Flp